MIQAVTHPPARPLCVSPSTAAGATSATLWWLNPAVLFALVALGTLAPAVALSDNDYSMYGTPKFLDWRALGVGVLACLMVAVGAAVGMHVGTPPKRISSATRQALVPWFHAAAALTLFGYLAWVASAVVRGFRPAHVVQLLAGGDHEAFIDLKFNLFQTLPGVTTCTQFGLLALLLGGILLRRDTRYGVPLIGAVLALGALRVVIYSERLALLELIVLLGLVLLRTRVLHRPRGAAAHVSLLAAPVVGVTLLFVMMGATEYFRSWQYYQHEFDSLASFTASRLSGYYSTSHNNGAMAWNLREIWPLPYFTLQWFWNFPLVAAGPWSYESLVGFDPELAHEEFLVQWGNVEFNNAGGLFLPTLDFGVVGGACFWLAFGAAAGRSYRGFVAGSLAGLLIYPLFFLTILEMPRFLYLCTVRPFPAWVLAGVILWRLASPRKGADEH